MKSLRNAKTLKQICALERDNLHIGPKKRWSLYGSEKEVHLDEQAVGDKPTQSFSIPRKFFDELINFYMAEQKPDALPETAKATRKANPRREGSTSRAQAARGRSRQQAL